ncbi:hypothetical protein ACIP5N_33920 [Streptomyces sp. NPDC088768]|uniref:hypothetical protein n=1 Tax=Streptomyces sp. NPDC088768 TaxID=3365894 RepID=UPI0038294410
MEACRNAAAHRSTWTVDVRRANHSAFNGYRRTSSPYSQVRCHICGAVWRTKAAYVDTLPDSPPRPACQACTRAAGTACRICHQAYCASCLTDHHHEGYGAPATG